MELLADDLSHLLDVRLVGYKESVCSDGLMQKPLLTGNERQFAICLQHCICQFLSECRFLVVGLQYDLSSAAENPSAYVPPVEFKTEFKSRWEELRTITLANVVQNKMRLKER